MFLSFSGIGTAIVNWFSNVGKNVVETGRTAGDNIGTIIAFAAIVAGVFVIAVLAEWLIDRKNGQTPLKKAGSSVSRMTIIAMLSAVAIIFNIFGFTLPFVPGFYKIDISELPVMIGAFALGPFAGVLIELIKILLNLVINGTVTMFIGEIANFVIGCAFVVPASIIYYYRKNRRNAVVGLTAGTVINLAAGALLNAFLLIPVYSKVFFKTAQLDTIIGMGAEKNSLITDLKTFVVFAVIPFNLIKCGVVFLIVMLIYKPISRILKRDYNGH